MRIIFKLIFLINISCFSLMSAQDGLPPIIDREILFGNPEISTAKLSPTGKFISFIKPYKGVSNIWVKGRYDTFDAAIPVTADTKRPIRSYFWSRDEKYILYVQDKGGDENFQVYAVDPDGEIKADGVPESRNITDGKGVRAIIMAVPKSNKEVMYVGINDRDPAWHDLYEVNIASGERKLMIENTQSFTGFYFNVDDELTLASSSDPDGGTIIYKRNGSGNFTKCFECNVEETCYPVRGAKDKNLFYFVSNKGEADLSQLGTLNLSTNEFSLIESDPSNQVDFGSAMFSDITNELISTSYTGDKKRIYWKNDEFQSDFRYLKKEFPEEEIVITSMTDNEAMWIVYVNSDTDPGAAYLFRREDKNIEFLYKTRPDLPTEYLSEMQAVRYKSSDGLEISAYLTLPKGIIAQNLPAIIMPHGGPWARDTWGYHSWAQFLANRGYVVLQPNFRGSTGFGKAFLNAGNNEWGQLMQDDLTAGVEFLVDKGYADPDYVGIMGGSYGGYATLAGLTFTPDVYAAGVSIVGPSNLFTLLETIPAYWESFRKVFHKRMGDPSTDAGKEQLKKQSPFFHANNIKAPLLVAQGNNDPRVKTAESDQIVVAMRELGLPVEYINFMDEGHGFANPDNNMAFLSVAEQFLAKHLGGRYQKEVPGNIAKIVKDNTVDIATVKIAEPITDEMKKLPANLKPLKESENEYSMMLELGPQQIPMTLKRSVKVEGNQVKVTDIVDSQMGISKDVSILDAKTLKLKKKEVEQGQISMSLDLSNGSIKGSTIIKGEEKAISKPLENPTFSGGSGLPITIGALPLKSDYSSTFVAFDSNSQSLRTYRVDVIAKEKISAGRQVYECLKIDLSSLDGNAGNQQLWYDVETNTLVKSVAIIKEMNGAKLTTELLVK